MMENDRRLDRSEFNELIREHYNLVLRTANRSLSNLETAADAAQNTFLKAWIARNTLRNQDAFVPWILTICRREAWAMRAENRSVLLLDASEEHPDTRNHGSEQDSSELFHALERLPERDLDLIFLKYFAGYSLSEIAILQRIPASKVKSRLHTARQKLLASFHSGSSKMLSVTSTTLSHWRIGLMNQIEIMDLGSWCFPRLSFQSQLALCQSSKENGKFPAKVLGELSELPNGADWIKACGGKLSEKELVSVLVCCDNGTLDRILSAQEDKQLEEEVLRWKEQFYMVRHNDPVLNTPDMETLVDWFGKVLGWHGAIGCRDEQGEGLYGCVYLDEPYGLEKGTRSFTGFHLFHKDHGQGVLAVIEVRGLEKLRQRVEKATGEPQPELCNEGWGSMTLLITTPCGNNIKFYEWIKPEDAAAPYRKE